MDWQEQYENAADAEGDSYSDMPLKQVLYLIKQGCYGEYYSIWRDVEERATLAEAGWLLYEVLHRDIDYLIRCNAAEALLTLLDCTDVMENLDRAVTLTAYTVEERAPHLTALKQELEEKIGPPAE
jgi:hypothetical protein